MDSATAGPGPGLTLTRCGNCGGWGPRAPDRRGTVHPGGSRAAAAGARHRRRPCQPRVATLPASAHPVDYESCGNQHNSRHLTAAPPSGGPRCWARPAGLSTGVRRFRLTSSAPGKCWTPLFYACLAIANLRVRRCISQDPACFSPRRELALHACVPVARHSSMFSAGSVDGARWIHSACSLDPRREAPNSPAFSRT